MPSFTPIHKVDQETYTNYPPNNSNELTQSSQSVQGSFELPSDMEPPPSESVCLMPLAESTNAKALPTTQVLPLETPFGNTYRLRISVLNKLVNGVFFDTLKEYEKEKIPFFVAITKDTKNRIKTYDAFSFLSLDLAKIKDMQIYRLDAIADNCFKSFCTLTEYKKHTFYKCHLIASDLNPSELRGQARGLLGTIYRTESKCVDLGISVDPDKSFFWYEKSAEDKYFDGYFGLSVHYNKARNEELFYKNLELAVNVGSVKISTQFPRVKQLYKKEWQRRWTNLLVKNLDERSVP